MFVFGFDFEIEMEPNQMKHNIGRKAEWWDVLSNTTNHSLEAKITAAYLFSPISCITNCSILPTLSTGQIKHFQNSIMYGTMIIHNIKHSLEV